MKKSELRQLIRQVIKEQITKPKDKFLKPKKDLKLDPRIKVPGSGNMAQPKSGGSGCPPEGRTVKVRRCYDSGITIYSCALISGTFGGTSSTVSVPQVGQMVYAPIGNQIPQQIIDVSEATATYTVELTLPINNDILTATECGYNCEYGVLGTFANEMGSTLEGIGCVFVGDGTAQYDDFISCIPNCTSEEDVTPTDPCKDAMSNTMVDLDNNLIAGGATYGDTMTGVQGQTLYDWYWTDPDGNIVAHTDLEFRETVFTDLMNRYNEEMWSEIDSFGVVSPVVGFDWYHYKNNFWMHLYGSYLLPYHKYVKGDEQFSYLNRNNWGLDSGPTIGGDEDYDQWEDYQTGLVFGWKINRSIGIFFEGEYTKFWDSEIYNSSVGLNITLK